MNVNNDTILDIAKEVQRLISELNRANLLNTVHVNENTHSRILKMILEYSHDGQYPFFEDTKSGWYTSKGILNREDSVL